MAHRSNLSSTFVGLPWLSEWAYLILVMTWPQVVHVWAISDGLTARGGRDYRWAVWFSVAGGLFYGCVVLAVRARPG